MKRVLIFTAVGCWLVLSSLGASAQEPRTVGQLLDRGGKQLTREEVAEILSGAMVSGIQFDRPEVTFQNLFKPDGTVRGNATNRNVRFGEVTLEGTWAVDDQGRLCTDLRNSQGTRLQFCTAYFLLDGAYHGAKTADRSAEVYRRDVKR